MGAEIWRAMRMNATASGLEALIAAARTAAGDARAPAPVDDWNPEFCGEGGFEILRDGTWLHEGARIPRESLTRLFSTILRKDADGITYLVTPTEKIIVHVADAPFLAVRADRVGVGVDQAIVLTTNMGDVVALGPAHPLRIAYDAAVGEPRPYALVRGRLEARILRAPFYELVDWAVERDGRLGVWSQGAFFDLEAT